MFSCLNEAFGGQHFVDKLTHFRCEVFFCEALCLKSQAGRVKTVFLFLKSLDGRKQIFFCLVIKKYTVPISD